MSTLRYRYQTFEFGGAGAYLRTLREKKQFSNPDFRKHDTSTFLEALTAFNK
jgi:hypothetical protein